jgi:ABC-type branched-subunit amino acid transport system substrate-binding protein
MTKDEALKLALEALKQIDEAMPFPVAKLAQAAIKEALAQPEQEPVAWMHTMDNTEGHKANKPYVLFTKSKRNPFGVAGRDYSKSYPVTKQPLYTTPPPCPTCEALARTVMLDQTGRDA